MPIPRVAIVGRPNAGKSSLMNMIAGAKVSIVDPTPGVTRDRVAAIVDLQPPSPARPVKPVEFVDTGGFGVYTAEGKRYDEVGADLATLTRSIERQIAQAVEHADLVLFAVDCQQGLTPADEQIARMLREGGFHQRLAPAGERTPYRAPPIRIVATKCDGPRWEAHAFELAALGFDEPLMCSAKNNYMRRDFLDAVYDLLPDPTPDQRPRPADLLLAIVGKRNAGKSTLVNTLAGEERVIVSEIAGTTRDAVDVRFDFGGRSLVAIDTAGLRRKKSFQDAVEHYAFDRAQRAVDRADVVLLLLDAAEKISQVDEQLAALVQKSYKPAIIVVNKWDLAEGRADAKGRPASTSRYESYIRKELQALWFAPIAFVQASSGRNVRNVIDLAFELKAQSEERVTTGRLNRFVRSIFETQGPTDTKGTHAKLYYVAQTGIAPPTITMVVNHPELFRPNYIRFLMNRFREALPFQEVPMRIVIRSRRQREDDLAAAAELEHRAETLREASLLHESELAEGPVRVKRGRKGLDPRARQRALELQQGPSDAELLADFDSPQPHDDDSPNPRLIEDTVEHDTGYDAQFEHDDDSNHDHPDEPHAPEPPESPGIPAHPGPRSTGNARSAKPSPASTRLRRKPKSPAKKPARRPAKPASRRTTARPAKPATRGKKKR